MVSTPLKKGNASSILLVCEALADFSAWWTTSDFSSMHNKGKVCPGLYPCEKYLIWSFSRHLSMRQWWCRNSPMINGQSSFSTLMLFILEFIKTETVLKIARNLAVICIEKLSYLFILLLIPSKQSALTQPIKPWVQLLSRASCYQNS